jgi:flagellar biosynthetic protein FliO
LGQGEGNLAVSSVYTRKWPVVFLAFVLLFASGIPSKLSAAERRARKQERTEASPGVQSYTEGGAAPGGETRGTQAPGNQVPGQNAEQLAPGTQPPAPQEPETVPAYDYTAPDFGENRSSYPFLVLRTLAVLAVLVIVIYLVFRVFLKNRHKIVASTEVIKVLATYPLAGNKTIQIVQIADKVLILGITDSNINLISTLEDKETIDKIKLESSKETRGFQSFKDQLVKLISGKAFSGQGQASYFNEFKQRINKMKKL